MRPTSPALIAKADALWDDLGELWNVADAEMLMALQLKLSLGDAATVRALPDHWLDIVAGAAAAGLLEARLHAEKLRCPRS